MGWKTKAQKNAYSRKYYQKWKKTTAGKKHAKRSMEWFQTPAGKKYAHSWENATRLEALMHYGGNPPKCKCCGESGLIFLTLDHTNGRDGVRQRKIGSWLKKNNWPKGYQVLCYNCNCAKGQNKKCPHGTNKVNFFYHRNTKTT